MFTCMLGHYVSATVMLIISTFHGMLTESANSCRDKECPFSGITDSGRVLEERCWKAVLRVCIWLCHFHIKITQYHRTEAVSI